MTHSSKRIIRGEAAQSFRSWDIDMLGGDYAGPVERLMGQLNGTRNRAEDIPPTEQEIFMRQWEAQLTQREAQIDALERDTMQKAEEIGQQRGYEAGWDAAHHERVALIQAANSMTAEFERFKTELGEKILDLAVLVAKKVVGDTVQLHPEQAYAALQDILNSMSLDEKSITLVAHPHTLDVLAAQFGDQRELAGVKLLSDPKQLNGGFVLRHPEGEVDATLQNRWLRAIEALDRHIELTDDDLKSNPIKGVENPEVPESPEDDDTPPTDE
ncbi:MAG: FliH/SctL family protein [Limnobacter sp.]|nr:FliH/SctL family protein [Limnobacter sp.]